MRVRKLIRAKFCKKCGRILRDYNESGFCQYHNHLELIKKIRKVKRTKFCKKCNLSLNKNNFLGYCKNHRSLSTKWKAQNNKASKKYYHKKKLLLLSSLNKDLNTLIENKEYDK